MTLDALPHFGSTLKAAGDESRLIFRYDQQANTASDLD
jgi:hypothetical protein